MYESVKGDIAKMKQLHKLTYSDIGKMVGYKGSTIALFMCGSRESPAVAESLAQLVKKMEVK